MRHRLGLTQADVAAGWTRPQGPVRAIRHAKPGAMELRTLASYIEAFGGGPEITEDSGDQWLSFGTPVTSAAWHPQNRG